MRRRSIYWIGVPLVVVAVLGAWLSVWWAGQNQVRALVAETGGGRSLWWQLVVGYFAPFCWA